MSLEVRCYTDPACPWSWGCEPQLRRLLWELGDRIEVRWVMGGLAREYGTDPATAAEQMSLWLQVSAETGMPTDPRVWREGPISSTYPACLAVKAAAEQGAEAASTYLRRVREGILVERRKLDGPEALITVAGEAGLDVGRFRIDIASNAITEAFAADLEEVRGVPAEARAEGESKDTPHGERLALPSLVFVAEDGTRDGVWGPHPYDAYRDAALAAGAPRPPDERPDPLDVVSRLGRVATAELEEITGRARIPLEAELWDHAREWRLRPVHVLGGTLWEAA